MPARMFQAGIYEMQNSLGKRTAGVLDENNSVIASNDVSVIGEVWENVSENTSKAIEFYTFDGKTFKKLGKGNQLDYTVYCEGEDDYAKGFVGIISVALSQLKHYYDEKYDKISFIKNILIDNILVGDVYPKAKALYLNTEAYRVAFLIRTVNEEYASHDVLSGLFPDKNKDFIIGINETDVVLVKETKEDVTLGELEKIASTIV
ncbi:MAG: PucR family transcriptional regulator, partial [Clostridiaceae bacterium]|nr:PucR family transcriptional regulator [Clostridiaceae bacterium]